MSNRYIAPAIAGGTQIFAIPRTHSLILNLKKNTQTCHIFAKLCNIHMFALCAELFAFCVVICVVVVAGEKNKEPGQ